jgi:hypothetical protein
MGAPIKVNNFGLKYFFDPDGREGEIGGNGPVKRAI